MNSFHPTPSDPGGGREEAFYWSHVVGHAGWGVAIGDPENDCFQSVNPAFARMHGYTVEELIGKPIGIVYSRAAQLKEHVRIAHKTGRHVFEADHVRKDGSIFPAEIDVSVFTDDSGKILYRAVYVQDITERRQAQQALREGEARLTSILESAMDAIVTLDEDGRITLFNAAAESVFGVKSSQVLGERFDRFATPALSEVISGSGRVFERNTSRGRYLWAPEGVMARRADASEFPIEATLSQTISRGCKLTTLILRDTNERERAEQELQQLELENSYLREKAEMSFSGIVGKSKAISEVLRAVKQVAATSSTVLILGETGTGKELIARAIHTASPLHERILTTVNCAALPSGLIESELFGHEKGAFTGALRQKIGRFELANGGTIFLDEIGDLPLELQAKLLRVLQEGEFERVGGNETLKVNVRVIAATNRDLEEAVAKEKFRSDLYYRLNVFPIVIPSLNERVDDVPRLVNHFIKIYCKEMRKCIEKVPRSVMEALKAYHWPGNVRELQNIIERAVILTRGKELELHESLPKPKRTSSGASIVSLKELEREHIKEVLEMTGWRVSGPRGAAKLLDIKPTTLASRMKALSIERPGR